MAGERAKVAKFLEQLPEKTEVTSSVGASKADDASDNSLFTTLTGSSHSGLKKTWKKEQDARDAKIAEAELKKGSKLTEAEKQKATRGMPNTTTCNGFTGKIGQTIGSTFATGQFELEDALKKAGLGEAWVPASSGKKPQLGDVFRMVKWHVGVSVKFDGETWHTAESGQGGHSTGYDIVKRKQQPWKPELLKGWIDIEILMELLGSKSPAWMKGWWRFEIGGAKEFVFFPDKGRAIAVDAPPANLKIAPASGRSGKMTVEDDAQGVVIVWSPTVTDRLRHLPGVSYMLGDRGGAQIQAFQLK